MTNPTVILSERDEYCTVYTLGPSGWAGRRVARIEVTRTDSGNHEIAFRLFRGQKPVRVRVQDSDLVVVRGHWPEQPIGRNTERGTFDRWLAGKHVMLDVRSR